MRATVVIRLTPYQAKILWGVVDGAQDAGACVDGLSPEEQNALEAVNNSLIKQHEKWKNAK